LDLLSGIPISLNVNGQVYALEVPSETRLLSVLRHDLALKGPKYGCGLGECGACTVLIDGKAVRSCVLPARQAVGRDIVTLEGLGTLDQPHPVQVAFIAAQAAQCGYCLNGMIMSSVALLTRNPDPSDAQIRQALRHNLCRCGTHIEIMEAVRIAAGALP
jgi:nicotinate dehydrogenase subunit A